jgi:hypothetical protein
MSFGIPPVCLFAPLSVSWSRRGIFVLGIPSGAAARAMMRPRLVTGHPGHDADFARRMRWLQEPILPGTPRIVLKDYGQEWSQT